MLASLLASAPGVRGEHAPAEHLPLDDASVDALFAAQAWHWFDAEPTAREFRRVLRPGGVVGILWNDRDDTATPWLGELRTLLEDHFVARYTSDESAGRSRRSFRGWRRTSSPTPSILEPEAVIGPGVDVLLCAAPRRRRRGDRCGPGPAPRSGGGRRSSGDRDPPPHGGVPVDAPLDAERAEGGGASGE